MSNENNDAQYNADVPVKKKRGRPLGWRKVKPVVTDVVTNQPQENNVQS